MDHGSIVETTLKEILRLHLDENAANSLYDAATTGQETRPFTIARVENIINRISSIYTEKYGDFNIELHRDLRAYFNSNDIDFPM